MTYRIVNLTNGSTGTYEGETLMTARSKREAWGVVKAHPERGVICRGRFVPRRDLMPVA